MDESSVYAAAAIMIGTVSAIALAALQSDRVGRHILAPNRLLTKRLLSYHYQWNQSLQLQKLKLRYYWHGDLGKGDDPTTLILTLDQELDDLVQAIVASKMNDSSSAMYTVGSIAKDENAQDVREYFLWLFHAQEKKVIQVPAVAFGLKLAEAFEKKICSSTLCFVHDAAAGTGLQFITQLLKECCKETVTVVANGNTPAWMIQWALLKDQRVYSNTKLHRLLFALCRLEAQPFRRPINTVVLMIPTAVVPILLPALHDTFPDDRHVLCYTGCVRTVQYAEATRGMFRKTQVPSNLAEAVSFGKNPVQHNTPVNANAQLSMHIMSPYPQALADLPVDTAGIVETWMAAVDTYLVHKNEMQVTNFLPYVCRLDYMVDNGPLEKNQSPRYWSIRSLVQFVTGTAARELSDQMQNAIVCWLKAYKAPADPDTIEHPLRKEIENCVFQHKLILLANKILLDTVVPQQHWTLKQATKRGCACCIPDDDPDGEIFFARRNGTLAKGVNRGATFSDGGVKSSRSRSYVDGSSAFAFDPNHF